MKLRMSALSLLFLSIMAAANEDFFVRYSVNAVKPYPGVKGLSIGLQASPDVLAWKLETGFLSDLRANNLAGYGQVGLGVEPKYGPVYFHFFQSVGAISAQDQYLSGYFQFFEDLGVGFKGTNGTGIGLGYKHISNAGITTPNRGKDLINLMVRFPLF